MKSKKKKNKEKLNLISYRKVEEAVKILEKVNQV